MKGAAWKDGAGKPALLQAVGTALRLFLYASVSKEGFVGGRFGPNPGFAAWAGGAQAERAAAPTNLADLRLRRRRQALPALPPARRRRA